MGREAITDVVLVPAEPRRVETRAPGSAMDGRTGTSLHAGSRGPQAVGMQETARGGSTGHGLGPRCRGQGHPPRLKLRRGGGRGTAR